MEFSSQRGELKLTHKWTISTGSASVYRVLFVTLRDVDGLGGIGEAAPSGRYQESIEKAEDYYKQVDAGRLSFADVPGSMAYLEGIGPGNRAAKGALNMALLDGAAKRAGQPVCDWLGLGFREGAHRTSFSIGIDSPAMIREKVALAEDFPILKLKVGVAGDRENLEALRSVAPSKRVRVDANEGWRSKEQALGALESLARDGNIEFCEQPMPAATPPSELAWLKERSPIPLMADESYVTAADIEKCADCFHAVNVKLIKAGGIMAGQEALLAARRAGLKTMLGCMLESSILISAAAHLAELADYLDLDGNLLVSNDPYEGVMAEKGVLSFLDAPEKTGLRVRGR